MVRAITILSCLIASVLAGSVSLAVAGDRSITVPYADLNLAEADGVAVLYHRIEAAATRLCGPREVGGPDVDSLAFQQCVVDAVARAISVVDRPTLTAYHMRHVRR
jgi:UrcA family protein